MAHACAKPAEMAQQNHRSYKAAAKMKCLR